MATEKPVTLADVYVLWWSDGGLIPTIDCNPEGSSEPLMLLVGLENAKKAAEYQQESWGDGDNSLAEPILLTEAIKRGLLK